MPEFLNAKVIVIAVLFAAFIAVKFLGGNRAHDLPARRRRRFGPRGTMSPLRNPEKYPPPPEEPPKDPEEEFFKGS
ncbi:MAG: hypothetical protein ACK4N5_12435 [Myxococcales bacterium]